MGGVLAALLARKGFTSSTKILEAERGYLRATAGAFDIERITQDLGSDFEATKNIFKRHASCGHTHGAIDAVLEIVERHWIKADDINKILVGTYPIAVSTTGERYEPGTADEAKFSLPYCVAAALIYGKVGLEEFSAEKLALPKILDLTERVEAFVARARASLWMKGGWVDLPKDVRLTTPLRREDVADLFVGDVVHLRGIWS
jgi:2-methylcitrate dehydratase PrpD